MDQVGKEAVVNARKAHEDIMGVVTQAFGLNEKADPRVAREMARYLAHGHVSFNIDVTEFLTPVACEQIEAAFEAGFQPLMVAAGWMHRIEEANMIFGVDEMWIDPEARHARAFLEEGLVSVLVVSPGSGRIVLRTDATEFFMKQGWRIVPQERFEKKSEEAYDRYYAYLDEAQVAASG